MAEAHNFTDSLKKGDVGEELILNYLNKNDNIDYIEDVSNNVDYQKVDIDSIIHFKSGKTQTLEIKTDFYKSPNFFYEVMSAIETGSVGCFEKTEADRLIYYYINLNLLYVFDMPKYREWVRSNKEEFDKKYGKYLKNNRYNGTQYTSFGYAFPRYLIDSKDYYWVSKKEINLRTL